MSHRFSTLPAIGLVLALANAGAAEDPGNPPNSRSGDISVLGISLGMTPDEVQTALEANAGVKQDGKRLSVKVTRKEGQQAFAKVAPYVIMMRSESQGTSSDPMDQVMGIGPREEVRVLFLGPPNDNTAVSIFRKRTLRPSPEREPVRASLLKRYGPPTLDEGQALAWFWDEAGTLGIPGPRSTINKHPCFLRKSNPPPSCRRQLIVHLVPGSVKDSVGEMIVTYADAYGERDGKRQTSKLDADAYQAQQEKSRVDAEIPDL
ncbi:MAG: hypothetical protein GY723_03790 [bacterium]|nr:hypothetical protein [bacterium]MCP5069252.1 hypothetical protein [bacterium]